MYVCFLKKIYYMLNVFSTKLRVYVIQIELHILCVVC